MRPLVETFVILVFVVAIWVSGYAYAKVHAQPVTGLPIDRLLLDGHVATWWIERAEGSSVAVIRVQTRP